MRQVNAWKLFLLCRHIRILQIKSSRDHFTSMHDKSILSLKVIRLNYRKEDKATEKTKWMKQNHFEFFTNSQAAKHNCLKLSFRVVFKYLSKEHFLSGSVTSNVNCRCLNYNFSSLTDWSILDFKLLNVRRSQSPNIFSSSDNLTNKDICFI